MYHDNFQLLHEANGLIQRLNDCASRCSSSSLRRYRLNRVLSRATARWNRRFLLTYPPNGS